MKPLMIELKKGAARQLQSIGWKNPSADDCRRHFFALDRNGKALVVTPKPAMPQFYDPCKASPAVLTGEPFPEAVCVEISPCRLLAPPCYQSAEDFENQRPCHRTFEPWKWIYLQTHNQALILESGDDGPLQERLDKWLAAMRAAYEHESHVLRAEIERQKTKPLAELGYENEEQRKKHVLELQAVLENIVESETPIDNAICKGRMKLTLADVKHGHEGIRDAWLHEDWALKNGEDLGAMFRERLFFPTRRSRSQEVNGMRRQAGWKLSSKTCSLFGREILKWLEKHTGTPANIFDLTTRERRHGISPPGFSEKYEQDPRFLEACASVRFRARFADNAGSVVYLENCEIREELTAQERDEVAKLTGTSSQQTQSAPKPAAAPPPSPTPDALFEYVNVQGTEWRKAGPQMVRRRELAEHQRTTKDDSAFSISLPNNEHVFDDNFHPACRHVSFSFWFRLRRVGSLLELHRERWFYPVKQIVEVRDAANSGKDSPVAAMFDITDWDSNWHPPGAPNWVHPGRKSEPFRANQS